MPDEMFILNVDDSEASRYYISRLLQRAGYIVREGRDGSEALRLAAEQPELIVLDIHLPDISGLEVCRRLKSDPATASIPVLHLSATSIRSEDRVAGLEGGADAYLTQPVEPKELLATVRALLRARRAEESLRRIQWLLRPELQVPRERPEEIVPPYGDLAALNRERTIADAVGPAMLREITGDFMDLLESSAAVFEAGGDYAMLSLHSGWCRLLEESSRRRCGTEDNRAAMSSGRWLCHDCRWRQASKAMAQRGPVDAECAGGIRIYALPILAGEKVVGAVCMSYGDPPRRLEKLREIAEQYGVDLDSLRKQAEAYESRPPFILEIARKRLHSAARLMGEILDRRNAEREAQRAREVAESANRAKDRFLAVLSHEMRTPLAPVLLTLDEIQRNPLLPPELADDLAMVRRNVEMESRLIDDLLDVSAIARGKITIRSERVDAHAALRDVLAICQPAAQAKRLTLEASLEASRFLLSADPGRLQQVFWNLLKNAIKFTPADGRVQVRTRNLDDGRLAVEVSDTGIGIDPTALPRIFEAFTQEDRSITQRFGGLGLGLAISRAIVEAMGGTLSGWSDGRGQGARFVVELETVADAAEEAPQAPPTPPPATVGDRRVLLVEDHEDTRRVLSRLLERFRCQVRTAGSVREALAAAEAERFDLVISDIGLPDGSGVDLMRELRSRYGLRGIAMSGYGMEEDLHISVDAGFEAHLVKPVSVQQLEEAIGRLGAT